MRFRYRSQSKTTFRCPVRVNENRMADFCPFDQVDDLYIPLVYTGIVIENRYKHQSGISDETEL